MASLKSAPDFIRALNPTVLAAVRKACGGDWSRVTPDLVVHNNPVRSVKPPVRRVSEKPPEPRQAPVAPAPAPRVRSAKKKPAERRTAPTETAKERRQRERAERIALESSEPVYVKPDGRVHTRHVEEPVRRDPKTLHGSRMDLNGFTEDSPVDGGVAYKTWHKFHRGFFGRYTYHANVLALSGIDLDIFDDCLRFPDSVIVAPETKDKGYPVLRFKRGDMMAVMGFRFADDPAVIAAYHNLRVGRNERYVKGGGGTKKQSGPPKSPAQVMSRLADLGATVKYDELRDPDNTEVWYDGQCLGKISTRRNTHRDTCESDWNRMQRKIGALKRSKGS